MGLQVKGKLYVCEINALGAHLGGLSRESAERRILKKKNNAYEKYTQESNENKRTSAIKSF